MVQRVLDWFWLDLYNRRAMAEMLAVLHPDYRQRDHRLLAMPVETHDDWRAMMESWWELVPTLRVSEAPLLAGDEQRWLCALRFEGGDPFGGGASEWVMYVVSSAAPDGRTVTADIFEDRGEAEAFFAGGG